MIDKADLAEGDDEVELSGVYKTLNRSTVSWKQTTSWNSLFRHLGPRIISEPMMETGIREVLAKTLTRSLDLPYRNSVDLDIESFDTVKAQMMALGWVNPVYTESVGAFRIPTTFWYITKAGKQKTIQLLALRKPRTKE